MRSTRLIPILVTNDQVPRDSSAGCVEARLLKRTPPRSSPATSVRAADVRWVCLEARVGAEGLLRGRAGAADARLAMALSLLMGPYHDFVLEVDSPFPLAA